MVVLVMRGQPMTTEKIQNALLTVMTAAALIVAVALIRKEFFKSSSQLPVAAGPRYLTDWRRLVHGGESIGRESAPVTLIVFSDYECPFCKSFHDIQEKFIASHPDSIRIIFHHLPLDHLHFHAEAAAMAAECASLESRFQAMTDVLFAHQDQIGLRSWGWFAQQAGVTDTSALVSCVSKRKFAGRVQNDRELAKSIEVTGTPTILLNQWMLFGVPSRSTLDSLFNLVTKPRRD